MAYEGNLERPLSPKSKSAYIIWPKVAIILTWNGVGMRNRRDRATMAMKATVTKKQANLHENEE